MRRSKTLPMPCIRCLELFCCKTEKENPVGGSRGCTWSALRVVDVLEHTSVAALTAVLLAIVVISSTCCEAFCTALVFSLGNHRCGNFRCGTFRCGIFRCGFFRLVTDFRCGDSLALRVPLAEEHTAQAFTTAVLSSLVGQASTLLVLTRACAGYELPFVSQLRGRVCCGWTINYSQKARVSTCEARVST